LVRAASELATGLEHTTGNFLHEVSIACHRFDRKLERSRNHPLNTNVCRQFLNEVREPLTFLIDDFERQAEFRTFAAFKREPCRLDELIDDCLHLLRKQIQNIDVVKKFASAPSVFCDKKQVKQIFINLLTNSREAISRNGKIIIKMTVSAHRDYVVTRIEDNGSGVPRKLRSQVFEPFFTTKEGPGRGLGLSTSRFIAERNGGSLKLRFPRRGRGMVAEVSLPVERKEVR
jgi:C4-dicarboxylate-specific signal transduction histidine kinase